MYLALAPALLFGSWLMRGAGYEFPADGLPYLPGALLVGLALAALLVRPLTRSRPTSSPAEVDEQPTPVL
jgi:hypothetical protein